MLYCVQKYSCCYFLFNTDGCAFLAKNERPLSELEEKSRLIGELQAKLQDLSSKYELEKVTAGKSAEDVVQLKVKPL